jgi:hypothetical protein
MQMHLQGFVEQTCNTGDIGYATVRSITVVILVIVTNECSMPANSGDTAE